MEVLQDDILRFLIGLFSLIPLCYILRFLPFTIRFWYSTIVALILQLWVYSPSIYPIFLQHLIVFAIIKLKGPKCGKLVTYQSIAFLGGYHIYQLLYNYGGWSMTAVALMMVLVPKYSLLAYNIEDGAADVSKLTDQQKRFRITQNLSFLDYLGYLCFLPTCMVGPPLQYRDYKYFMDGTEVYGHIPTKELNKRMLITFGQVLLMGACYFFYESVVPLKVMRTMQFYQHSYFYVAMYVLISVSFARSKYYFAWKLCMVSVHASGVSYSGVDFSRVNTCNPYIVETTIHVREKINFWNIGVQEWLRKGIYNRSNFKNKSISQLWVFVISAIWHGFYAAYYISMLFWFTQLHLQGLIFKYCKNGRSQIVKLYNKSGKLGYALLSFVVQFFFSHMAVYFLILEGKYCMQMMWKLKLLPQIIVFIAIGVFSTIRPPRDPKPKDPQTTPLAQTAAKEQVKQE